MKVSAINSYNYKTHSLKQTSEPSFEGKLQLKETANKVFTKKNLFEASLLVVLLSKLTDTADIDVSEIVDFVKNMAFISFFAVTESPKQLEENIEFKKAETLEEAKAFAQEKLGIKKFKINDLEYANWVNEGLTNISNRFKGNVYFPRKIAYYPFKQLPGLACYWPMIDSILINKNRIEERVSRLEDLLQENSYEDLTKYNLGKGYDDFCKKLTKAYTEPESLSLFEKYSLVGSIYHVKERIKQLDNKNPNEINTNDINIYGNVYENEFETIYHEVGHCFDFKSDMALVKFLDLFRGKSELKNLQIPNYPKTNRLEFVASIFSGIMQGEKYPQEVMNIYESLIKFKMPI